jgi:hypothetical protein
MSEAESLARFFVHIVDREIEVSSFFVVAHALYMYMSAYMLMDDGIGTDRILCHNAAKHTNKHAGKSRGIIIMLC